MWKTVSRSWVCLVGVWWWWWWVGVLCSELITRDEDMILKEVGDWRDWRGWELRTGQILLVVQMWR